MSLFATSIEYGMALTRVSVARIVHRVFLRIIQHILTYRSISFSKFEIISTSFYRIRMYKAFVVSLRNFLSLPIRVCTFPLITSFSLDALIYVFRLRYRSVVKPYRTPSRLLILNVSISDPNEILPNYAIFITKTFRLISTILFIPDFFHYRVCLFSHRVATHPFHVGKNQHIASHRNAICDASLGANKGRLTLHVATLSRCLCQCSKHLHGRKENRRLAVTIVT